MPAELTTRVEGSIVVLRGQRVLLDETLAVLYGVPVKALNQAVKRNAERFPEDFMFQLTTEEVENLRSQIVTSSSTRRAAMPQGSDESERLRSQTVTLDGRRCGSRRRCGAASDRGMRAAHGALLIGE